MAQMPLHDSYIFKLHFHDGCLKKVVKMLMSKTTSYFRVAYLSPRDTFDTLANGYPKKTKDVPRC